MTVTGTLFPIMANWLQITIGASEVDLATMAWSGGNTEATFTLPEGTGLNQKVAGALIPLIAESHGCMGHGTTVLLDFAKPVVTRVFGCSENVGHSTAECPAGGAVNITIEGDNFGSGSAGSPIAVVLIGGNTCADTQHDNATNPHRNLTCTLPAGWGVNLGVTVVQTGQVSDSNPEATVSYEECPPSTFIDNDGACVICPSGFYSDVEGAPACTMCTKGKIANATEGAVECVDCSAGFYALSGQTACDACPSGSVAGDSGAKSCAACEGGKRANATSAAVECLDCVAGFYSGASVTACKNCPAGYVAGSEGAKSCTICDAGKHANADQNGTACVECSTGYFSASGETTCTICPAGYVAGHEGATGCASCERGKRANVATAATECVECAAGTFSQSDATTCSACPAGYVAALNGTKECTGCKLGRWAKDDARACEDCPACAEEGACATCANGVLCPGRGWWSPAAVTGSVASFNASTVLFPCLRKTSCNGTAPGCPHGDAGAALALADPNFTAITPATAFRCAEGHHGVLCAQCVKPGWFYKEGKLI